MIYDDIDIEKIEIIYKNIKNINIRIKPSCEVVVSAPFKTSKKSIYKFLETKREWIEKHLKNFKNKKSLKENEISFLGKIYKVEVKKSTIQKVEISDNKVYIYLHDINSLYEKEFVLNSWLYKKAEAIFEEYLYKWQKVVKKDINKVRIKSMKTRWGSCNHQKGYINLNINLMKYSLEAIEYVIFHELTHLIHPNHSKDFYNYIRKYMPDFKEREECFKNSIN